MDNTDIKRQYRTICDHLAKRRLKSAFDQLEKLILTNALGLFHDQWRELNQTYHYMLQYTVEGIRDPERQKIYRRLIDSTYELADQVYEALRLKHASSVEYEKKRGFKEHFISDFDSFLSQLEADTEDPKEARQKHQQIRRLFYYLWFQDRFSEQGLLFLGRFMNSPSILISYKAFVITAVSLSLQRQFDEQKFFFLFNAYESEEQQIKQRALVGLLLALYQYDSRLPFYGGITGRLKLLNDDPEFKRNLERVIIQLIRAKETEKLQQRIRDEIMPEMIKISEHLKDKIELDSLMEDGISEDKNPEWQEMIEESPVLMNKMQEFSELQMEGADVFLGSFAMLKSFPFFSEIANWFMPFFAQNPDLDKALDLSDDLTRRFVEVMGKAPLLCNSDKYSFSLSLSQIPQQNREFMFQGMQAEMDQFQEIEQDEALNDPGRIAGLLSNQYIQDLYRFYKLHPRRHDFDDLFGWRFDFHNKLTLGAILKEDRAIVRNIGEYYFTKNYFDEAIGIFEYLLTDAQDGELYQKLAFCYQKSGNYEKALDAYQKAELYDLNRIWNLKKIALCYRNLKQPLKALEYYNEVEALDHDDLSNHLNTGHCLLELGRFDEALQYYFKVEYLKPGNRKVWRPIGWCSFLTGKQKQAESYFEKLMAENPSQHDLMNMGHVQWALGNRKAALDYYKQAISKPNFTEADFMDVFAEDLPQLLKQGIDQDDVPIMLDQLRYFVEE
ncbi:tetratricopeptide repeat protein [Mangrovibacterium marinum]|uniref:Tetratricopeptide repeat protein n=1 Tax=Mangrovibacterium marinum TaxID=1639118 RepID=A0A2T5C440_9BACT|nr:tetratricopeptide repeat protein [Mangrovibacterium marinum]PTN09571.1 tetratricopeptide repeat protein [Mangrovibacterium marinum]